MSTTNCTEDTEQSLVSVRDLYKAFPLRRNLLGKVVMQTRAVNGVSLDIPKGQTLGLVGESGSGKSTVGQLIAGLLSADSGSVHVDGHDVSASLKKNVKTFRRSLQVIFQDPYSSLDPTKTIKESILEPLLVHGLLDRSEGDRIAADLLAQSALNPQLRNRYPRELSGGQRQRVAIARAMALEPEVLIADEPTSALDLSTRSEILNLLLRLQREHGLTILLISHDFATIRHIAHRVAVMYLGKIVEEADTQSLVSNPQHPYTKALLSAVPIPDPVVQRERQRVVLHGDLPNPAEPPSGCSFRTRCPVAMDVCAEEVPELLDAASGHRAACLRVGAPVSTV